MFAVTLRRLAGLFGPGGITLFLLLWFFSLPVSIYWLPVIRLVAPLLLAFLVVILSLRFGLVRLFYAEILLLMALSWVALHPGSVQFSGMFLVIGIDLLIFSLMPARKTMAIDTVVRLGLMFAQFPLCAFLVTGDAGIVVAVRRGLATTDFSADTIAVGAMALAALFLLWRAFRRDDVESAGLFWIMAAMILALVDEKVLVMPEYVLYLMGPLLLFTVCLEAAYDLAFRDRLTGLAARRAMDDFLRRLRPPYAVAMVDIDFFKKFNDRFGHDVGDQVLAKVASLIAAVGGGGRPFRYGGEEFAIVFPGRRYDRVEPRLERLRQRVEDEGFTVRGIRKNGGGWWARRGGGRQVGLTISIGLAGAVGGETTAAAMKKADQALYRAKKRGRNQVCINT